MASRVEYNGGAMVLGGEGPLMAVYKTAINSGSPLDTPTYFGLAESFEHREDEGNVTVQTMIMWGEPLVQMYLAEDIREGRLDVESFELGRGVESAVIPRLSWKWLQRRHDANLMGSPGADMYKIITSFEDEEAAGVRVGSSGETSAFVSAPTQMRALELFHEFGQMHPGSRAAYIEPYTIEALDMMNGQLDRDTAAAYMAVLFSAFVGSDLTGRHIVS